MENTETPNERMSKRDLAAAVVDVLLVPGGATMQALTRGVVQKKDSYFEGLVLAQFGALDAAKIYGLYELASHAWGAVSSYLS